MSDLLPGRLLEAGFTHPAFSSNSDGSCGLAEQVDMRGALYVGGKCFAAREQTSMVLQISQATITTGFCGKVWITWWTASQFQQATIIREQWFIHAINFVRKMRLKYPATFYYGAARSDGFGIFGKCHAAANTLTTNHLSPLPNHVSSLSLWGRHFRMPTASLTK